MKRGCQVMTMILEFNNALSSFAMVDRAKCPMDEVEIIGRRVRLGSVHCSKGVHPLKSEEVEWKAGEEPESRWTVDTSALDHTSQLVVSFAGSKEGHGGGRVYLPLKVGRAVRQRGWKALEVESEMGAERYKAYWLYDEGKHRVIILGLIDTRNWMGTMSDDTPLGDLTMPGTHESCALYGYPIAQCQQVVTPVAQQLVDGVRYLDVRLRVVNDNQLIMYHGPHPQKSSLPLLLDCLHSFLTANPTETLILCLKQETPPVHPEFAPLVWQAFEPIKDWCFLENRIPTLGEVRAKIILLTRFNKTEGSWDYGLGIHPSRWPDSRKEGFEWNCHGTTVRIQDWYRVKTFLGIPEKLQVVVNHLTPTLKPREEEEEHPFTLSYISAAYFPLSLPSTIARGFGWPSWGLGFYGMNERLMGWLLRAYADGKQVKACLPMDYYGDCGRDHMGLADVLVVMNTL